MTPIANGGIRFQSQRIPKAAGFIVTASQFTSSCGYVRTVLDSLHASHISLNKASGFLDNITVSDVHKLEAHVAGL